MNNGRVDTETSVRTPSGSFEQVQKQFAHATQFNASAGADLVKGNLEKNALNVSFFSLENVQIIQNKMIYEVYQRTQGRHRIGPQSVENLFMIMRGIYYQYGKNLPTHIKEQVTELNKMVVEFAVPKIIGEISMYEKYQHDLQTLPVPFQHPTNISRTGTKSLPLKPFF